MSREVDFIIIGAGVAGMTLDHVLRADPGVETLVLDPAPGRYKIGESIVPQHFMEPEVRPLYERVLALPSATPKEATLFLSEDSVGCFPPFLESPYTLHVSRADLEAETAAFFGTEVVRERVVDVDVEARRVTTGAGTYRARTLVADCTGPARVIGRKLGLMREVWPVFASWAYHDVVGLTEDRLFDGVRAGRQSFFRFDHETRSMAPSDDFTGFRPSHCTTLRQVDEGLWVWQIPLYDATRVSLGVVSRSGPVSAEAYRALSERFAGPQFQLALRPWDRSGPHDTFHVRNRFAWAADRFAGEGWALVGDAAFFGDPIYSAGTAVATNHAVQLARLLADGHWSARRARAFDRYTADLYARTKRAYDQWYFGALLHDLDVADEVQTDLINGRAFQVQQCEGFTEVWRVADRGDPGNALVSGRGEEVTAEVGPLLEEGGQLSGWQLASAWVRRTGLELAWARPDADPLWLTLEPLADGQPCFRRIGGLGLSYRPPKGGTGALDGQGRALLAAFEAVATDHRTFFEALLSEALG